MTQPEWTGRFLREGAREARRAGLAGRCACAAAALLFLLAAQAFGVEASPPYNVLVARGMLYQETVGARAGKAPNKYRLLEGPKGMELDAATGTIRWIVKDEGQEDAGVFRVRVQVTDAAGVADTVAFTLVTHDLIPLGSALPSFGAAAVHGQHLICLDQHGLTVRPLENTLAVVARTFRYRRAFTYGGMTGLPSALALSGDRLAASWEKSLALFSVSPSGALVLEGTIPCAGEVTAVAARGAVVAMTDRATLTILEIDDRGIPRQTACLAMPDVQEIHFVDGGLVVRHSAGALSFIEKKDAAWARTIQVATDAVRILASRGNLLCVASRAEGASLVAFPTGARGALPVPSRSAGAEDWAFWNDKGLFLPQEARRFRVSFANGQFSVEEDKGFSPRVPLAAVGSELLQVAGPAKLRRFDEKANAEAAAAAQPKDEPAAPPPLLLGFSKDSRMALGPGVLGWYEQGRVGAVMSPAGADPQFIEALHTGQIPAPTRMLVSAGGMCLETNSAWWWVDWRKPAEARAQRLVAIGGADFAVQGEHALDAVFLDGCLVYIPQRAPAQLHLVAAGAEVPDVQTIPAKSNLCLLAGEAARKLLYALDDRGALHVYRLEGEKLSELAAAALDFPEPISKATALTAGAECLLAASTKDFWLIDTSQPERPAPVATWRHDWVNATRCVAALGCTAFVENSHNTGPGILALDTSPARNKEGFTKVACHRLAGTLKGLGAADGVLLADFGPSAPPLLLASDAGYRAKERKAPPSVSLHNATLVRKASAIMADWQKRDEAAAVLKQLLAPEVPGAFTVGFEHWSGLFAAPDEIRADMLVGTYLDDHVGTHLNAGLARTDNAIVRSAIKRGVLRSGWSPNYASQWMGALSKGEADPEIEKALWHAAASPDGALCGAAFEALIGRGYKGAPEALVAQFPRAPVEAIPALSRALIAARLPQAKALIWARWQDLGDIANDTALDRYLRTAEAVSKLGVPAFTDLAGPLLQSPDPKVVARGVRIAAELHDDAAVKPLEGMLKHNAQLVQGEATLALVELGKPVEVASLRNGLAAREREFAERAMTAFRDDKFRGNKELLEVLREVLRDTAWDKVNMLVRYHAMHTIAQIGEKEDVEFLGKFEADANPHVKTSAQGARQTLLRRFEEVAVVARPPGVPGRPLELPSPEQFQKELATLKDADWQKPDPADKDLTWYGIDGGIALADAKRREVRRFPDLFGFQDLKVNEVAFGADKVWLATSKGLMAWDRAMQFWSRYAPTFDMMDAPVAAVAVAQDESVSIKIQAAKGALRAFVFNPKTEQWTEAK